MENELTITEILSQWKAGTLNIKSLWHDWFCKDTSLENKGKRLLQKLNVISKSTKFDNDNTYVFFKNNCPCNGTLYDDFRICDIKTGKVLYTIVPSSGFKSNLGKAELWGKENGFEDALIEGSWQDIKNWFLK